MSAEHYGLAAGLGKPRASGAPGGGLRRGWTVVCGALAAGVLIEAVFAGAMLSGAAWARPAHGLTAGLLLATSLAGGLVALVGPRRVPNGPRLGLTLLALAAVLLLQAALGVFVSKGANLLWAHVPVGVALVWVAARGVATARSLGSASA